MIVGHHSARAYPTHTRGPVVEVAAPKVESSDEDLDLLILALALMDDEAAAQPKAKPDDKQVSFLRKASESVTSAIAQALSGLGGLLGLQSEKPPSFSGEDYKKLIEIESLQPEKQVSAWADWGLENPDRGELALERMASFRSGRGDNDDWEQRVASTKVRKVAGWAHKNLSEEPAEASAQAQGALTVLSAVGSKPLTEESVGNAAEQLLRANLGEASEKRQEMIDFGTTTLRRMILDSGNRERSSEWFNNMIEMSGRGEQNDSFKLLVGLAGQAEATAKAKERAEAKAYGWV